MRWAVEAWGARNDGDAKVRASNRALLASVAVFGVLLVHLALSVALLAGVGA